MLSSLADMIWIEWHKAIRSRMPYWTALASLFMPAAIAFLIFVARNLEISQRLGLISAKANLMQFAAVDWSSYLMLSGQVVALAGFFLFVIITSWVFGREFVDGTVKDLLAVPVPRWSILLAKFVVIAIWAIAMAVILLAVSLALGLLLHLPNGSAGVVLQGSGIMAVAAVLTIAAAYPFAFLASAGRGYLLPIGVAVLIVIMTNVVVLTGWGEYFPWSVAGLYPQQTSQMAPLSFLLVLATGIAGMIATYAWWRYADQN